MLRRLVPLAALLCLVALPATASAYLRLPAELPPVADNPADALAGRPIEDSAYDPARRCVRTPRPGVARLVGWLARTQRGVFWGSYRCELWGKDSASLHAEGRAIDWHLDVGDPADKAAARRLVFLLLAPDAQGEPQALARRMGVQELIWDCGYWSAGMTAFVPYRPCYAKDRRTLRRRVNPTIAHRDHLHIGMTKAGAMARTSFWDR